MSESKTIDPQSVMIVTPTHDGNVVAGYAGGISACAGLFGFVGFVVGNSNVSLTRDIQAAMFLKNALAQWLLSIDADIQFTRNDLELLMEGDELIRVAEYAKKSFKPGEKPAQFGMGFSLIHRDVFDTLKLLKQFKGVTESHDGPPLIEQFYWEGEIVDHFFPTGPNDLTSHWIGEDHGFFHYARMANIATRVETRTRLIHWGRAAFPYQPQVASSELPSAS